jgi:hypothetical protein
MATELDLNFDKGSYFSKTIRVLNESGSNYDLTSHSALMQIRETHDSPTVALELSTVGGTLVINTINSTIEIKIPHNSDLIYSKYVYDLEITNLSGVPIRVIQGVVNVSPEVTR